MNAQKYIKLIPVHSEHRCCNIDNRHIEEMYERYESGMCDISTSNAIALALSDKECEMVRVYQKENRILARTANSVFDLSPHLIQWLDRVDKGLNVQETSFSYHYVAAKGANIPMGGQNSFEKFSKAA